MSYSQEKVEGVVAKPFSEEQCYSPSGAQGAGLCGLEPGGLDDLGFNV